VSNEKRKRFNLRKNLIALCSRCDIEMINMGNNDFHHFICTQCGKTTALFSDATITQTELDEQYYVEKAKISLKTK